jgi:hypothetical protein
MMMNMGLITPFSGKMQLPRKWAADASGFCVAETNTFDEAF